MIDFFCFLPLLLILTGFGKTLFNFLLPNEKLSFLEEIILGFALGAGAMGLLTLAIGLCGLLFWWVLAILLAVLTLIAWKNMMKLAQETRLWFAHFWRSDFSPFEKFVLLTFLFVAFFTLVGSLSPILGMDAAAYHMSDVKIFVQQHRIVPIPFTRESLWPFLIQMLFALGFCLRGVVLSKLFHFAYYGASFLAVYLLCRRYWPKRNSVLAASIFAITPAIFTGTTYAYTDLAVVFYTVLAFYGFFAWLDTNQTRWFCFSGIMCGFLLGIKITSAVVPAIILALYWHKALFLNIRFKQKTWPAIIFIVAMMAFCGVWYVRSWSILGNPIYPFASGFFNGNGYAKDYVRGFHEYAGIGMGWKQYIGMLWPLTLYPARFGGESIGVVFLIFLPMLLFAQHLTRFMRYVLVIVICLYTSWFIVYQYTRFFYPTLVFLSIAVAFVYYEICTVDFFVRRFATFLLVGLFCYSAALSVYHNLDKFQVVFGLVRPQDYLLKCERSYGIATYANHHLPLNAKILSLSEPRLYYFDREIVMANLVQQDFASHKVCTVSGKLDDCFKELGFGDYMVAMNDYSKNGIKEMPFKPRDFFIAYHKTLLRQVEFKYRNEHYVYELWKINGKIGEHP